MQNTNLSLNAPALDCGWSIGRPSPEQQRHVHAWWHFTAVYTCGKRASLNLEAVMPVLHSFEQLGSQLLSTLVRGQVHLLRARVHVGEVVGTPLWVVLEEDWLLEAVARQRGERRTPLEQVKPLRVAESVLRRVVEYDLAEKARAIRAHLREAGMLLHPDSRARQIWPLEAFEQLVAAQLGVAAHHAKQLRRGQRTELHLQIDGLDEASAQRAQARLPAREQLGAAAGEHGALHVRRRGVQLLPVRIRIKVIEGEERRRLHEQLRPALRQVGVKVGER
mmetsp:Transcript_30453/g.97177  ORF Transcript_30453/g.97177 Transcript_30453/m.97177 type:complete len:278 (-) Transcript_30453:697-1530(-)